MNSSDAVSEPIQRRGPTQHAHNVGDHQQNSPWNARFGRHPHLSQENKNNTGTWIIYSEDNNPLKYEIWNSHFASLPNWNIFSFGLFVPEFFYSKKCKFFSLIIFVWNVLWLNKYLKEGWRSWFFKFLSRIYYKPQKRIRKLFEILCRIK